MDTAPLQMISTHVFLLKNTNLSEQAVCKTSHDTITANSFREPCYEAPRHALYPHLPVGVLVVSRL